MSKQRSLNGREVAEYIKERQVKAVRGLRQQWGVVPKLAIVRTNPDPVVDSYMRIKQNYAADITAEVDVHSVDQDQALSLIEQLNTDDSVTGIIVQIPLPDATQTTQVLNAVAPHKDVDGLSQDSPFDPPTPLAVNWLLGAYNIDLSNASIVVVGQGRLVGAPLTRMWQDSGYSVVAVDRQTTNMPTALQSADVIVTATGVPGLITADMLKDGKLTIVDAGVATDAGGLVGDVASDVRERELLTITPQKGGVGPLTVAALFENLITATRQSLSADKYS